MPKTALFLDQNAFSLMVPIGDKIIFLKIYIAKTYYINKLGQISENPNDIPTKFYFSALKSGLKFTGNSY